MGLVGCQRVWGRGEKDVFPRLTMSYGFRRSVASQGPHPLGYRTGSPACYVGPDRSTQEISGTICMCLAGLSQQQRRSYSNQKSPRFPLIDLTKQMVTDEGKY